MDNNAILTEILERLSQMDKILSHHQSNWFKIEEAAEYTKFSKRQLHRWINEGILKTKKKFLTLLLGIQMFWKDLLSRVEC